MNEDRFHLGSIERRRELADGVISVLRADPRVRSVELRGSLGRGEGDRYSDIDLWARVSDISDRDFFFELPKMMDAVGPRIIDGWGFSALPDVYVATFYFDGYPLFWHLDIGVISDQHVDGSDLIQIKRWEQRFKMWVQAVRDLARAEDAITDIKMRVGKRMDLTDVKGSPADQLSQILDLDSQWHRDEGFAVERIHALCDELRRALLT